MGQVEPVKGGPTVPMRMVDNLLNSMLRTILSMLRQEAERGKGMWQGREWNEAWAQGYRRCAETLEERIKLEFPERYKESFPSEGASLPRKD